MSSRVALIGGILLCLAPSRAAQASEPVSMDEADFSDEGFRQRRRDNFDRSIGFVVVRILRAGLSKPNE